MATDWKQIKSEFEIMHVGVKELSVSHNVSVPVLQQMVDSQKWVKMDHEKQSEEIDALSTRMGTLATHYEAERLLAFNRLQAKTIDVCTSLLDKVVELSDAAYVKQISEVIEKLRPNVLAQKTAVANDTMGGGMKIAIINKFPIPQPGEDDYVAPNAVILGEHARQNNGISMDVDFQTIEIDLPDRDELN